ncbi:MAG: transcriptional repressor LexA [Peptostreptococcaceae bacterium]
MYYDLTEKQFKILNFLKQELAINGYPPTIREICIGVDLKSTGTVHSHLKTLEKKGYINRNPSGSRAISIREINEESSLSSVNDNFLHLPLVNNFSSGKDILDDENISDYIDIPKAFAKGKDNFVYLFKGNGMSEFGIYNNDYVIVDKTPFVCDGNLALVVLYGEFLTVRQYICEGNNVILRSNSDIVLDSSLVKVVGLVTGVIRTAI